MRTRDRDDPKALERRLARLEREVARLAPHPRGVRGPQPVVLHPGIPLALGGAVLACGYLGVGLPQHYYQPLFAALVVALAYHRSLWRLPPGHWRWPQVAVNFSMLCFFFKLVIGGGTRYPLDWLRLPALKRTPPAAGNPWYDQLFPRFDVEWQGIPAVTDLGLDLTIVQSLLLIATLAGALFRFQPFASLTAVLLLLVSIPTFMNFNWQWVVLFLVFGGIALYVQGEPFILDPRAAKAGAR